MRRLTGRLFWLIATGGTLFGQGAELSGFVRDPSGSAIPNATVEVRNEDTGARFRVGTNIEGLYSLTGLRPGTYNATVQAAGFQILTRSAITLAVGDRAALDFSLDLISLASSVTVTPARASPLSSTDPAVSTVVDPQFVGNMPLNGRSFQSLIHMTPGVLIMPSAQDAPGQFSVNGQRTNTNYFMVDGVSANFGSTPSVGLGQTISGAIPGLNILGGTNSLVSVDAMQEFRIQTSSYAPEYGRTPGAQVSIVTRSGGNQVHGTAYDYLRNDIFDARNWFNTEPQPKPPLRQNDFGGTVGGPIRKDHTFFFLSYEGLRLRQPATDTGNFLTAAARSQAPPVYQPLVNACPLPAGSLNPDGITAPLTVSYSNPSWFDAIAFRADHSTSRIILFARYDHAPSTQGTRYFAELENDIADIDTATGGATVIFSPSKVNDFRANWSRSTGTVKFAMQNLFGAVVPPASELFPAFSGPSTAQALFAIPFTSGELREGTRANNVQRQINLVDTFSMSTGVHQLKFGVDVRRLEPTNAPASYGYQAFPTNYQTLVSGLINFVNIFTFQAISVRLYNYSLFAQDTWRISNSLTLTYGLRWEINTPPASITAGKPLYAVTGLFDSQPLGVKPGPLWQTQFRNFAPRLGAAWRPTPSNVVRGGFGFFYDLGYGETTALSSGFPYSRSNLSVNNPGIPFDVNGPAFQPLPLTTTLSPTTSVWAVDPHLTLPVTYQWNAAWQRQFGASQAFTATYIGAWGRNLLRKDLVTPPGSILAAGGGAAQVTYNAGYSHYDGMQLQFLRRMSRGVQVMAAYTLARSKDTGSTDVGSGSAAAYTQNYGSGVSTLRLPPSTPSDFDARHLFSLAVSWELPRPLRGWVFDGLFRGYSAQPLNVLYQQILNSKGAFFDVQPDIVPGQPFWIPDANQPRGRVLNPQAFTQPAGETGNLPRNSLRGFPFSQTDLAVRRRFRLSERLGLDARVEYFNVLNHPNFAPPFNLWGYANVGPLPSFGKVTPGDTLNVGLGGGGGGLFGGQATLYAPGGPRSAQLSLRLNF